MDTELFLFISCEHGGHQIPPPYRHLFQQRTVELRSHAGYDAGALRLARELAAAFEAPLQAATVSRLLIDLNRSPGHPHLYSSATRSLAPAQRQVIAEHYYQPYRKAGQQRIAAAIAAGQRVLHIACHSFTPFLHGQWRDADLGLLYDPGRAAEAHLCRLWQAQLRTSRPDLKIRRNTPYRGRADGFITHLRRCFAEAHYVGIELELNQRHVRRHDPAWPALRHAIIASLASTLATDRRTTQPPPRYPAFPTL